VGPRAVLDAVVKRKIPSFRRESNPRTPIVQPIAQPLRRSKKVWENWKRKEHISFWPMLVMLLGENIHTIKKYSSYIRDWEVG
jgi:hypothetical protein